MGDRSKHDRESHLKELERSFKKQEQDYLRSKKDYIQCQVLVEMATAMKLCEKSGTPQGIDLLTSLKQLDEEFRAECSYPYFSYEASKSDDVIRPAKKLRLNGGERNNSKHYEIEQVEEKLKSTLTNIMITSGKARALNQSPGISAFQLKLQKCIEEYDLKQYHKRFPHVESELGQKPSLIDYQEIISLEYSDKS